MGRKRTRAKPGDTIRILEDNACGAAVVAGEEFTVAKSGKFGIEVEGDYPWGFWHGAYEIVTKEETP